MIAVSKCIPAYPIDVDTVLETLWLRIIVSFTPIIVGVCYRPPHIDYDFATSLADVLDRIHGQYPSSCIMLGGDFNYPEIQWGSILDANIALPSSVTQFLDLTLIAGLDQVVSFPTRLSATLDLFFTTEPSLVSNVAPLEPVADHTTVFVECKVETKNPTTARKVIFNYERTDIDGFNKELDELFHNDT